VLRFLKDVFCRLQRLARKPRCVGKPHVRCRCKIRYVSKFTAASRGFLCESKRLSCLLIYRHKLWSPSLEFGRRGTLNANNGSFFFNLAVMYSRLLLLLLFILLECSLCIKHAAGYFIHIDAHAEECFFDRVTSGTKMSLMFEVAEGGFLDIDVKVGFRDISEFRIVVEIRTLD